MAALFLLVLVALYALRATQAYLTQLTGQRVIHDLRAALFAHLQRQDARFYDRNPVGRLMTRVLNDVEAIQELFTSGVVAILGDVVVLTGVVVIMLRDELEAGPRHVRAGAPAGARRGVLPGARARQLSGGPRRVWPG